MSEEKCTWNPELHNGEPCPTHTGGFTGQNNKFMKGEATWITMHLLSHY